MKKIQCIVFSYFYTKTHRQFLFIFITFIFIFYTFFIYFYIFSLFLFLFIWGFTSLLTLNRSVGRADETSTYSWSRFCTINCRPTASNYQLSHLRPCWEPNPGLRGGRQECYHSATVAPTHRQTNLIKIQLQLPFWRGSVSMDTFSPLSCPICCSLLNVL